MMKHKRSNQISQAAEQFNTIPENQLVVYANQPIVFIRNLLKHSFNSFNERGKEKITQKIILVHS